METQNVKVCYVVNTNEEVKSIYKIDDTPDKRNDARYQGATAFSVYSYSFYPERWKEEPVRYGDLSVCIYDNDDAEKAFEYFKSFIKIISSVYDINPDIFRYVITCDNRYYLIIPAWCFGGENGDIYLPRIYKSMVFKMLDSYRNYCSNILNIDISLYSMGKLGFIYDENARLSNGRYAVPVKWCEIDSLPFIDLMKLTLQERVISDVNIDHNINDKLKKLFISSQNEIHSNDSYKNLMKKFEYLYECDFIQHCIKDIEIISDVERMYLFIVLMKFGKEGAKICHELAMCRENYSYDTTEKEIRRATFVYEPITCDKINKIYSCESVCDVTMPMLLFQKSIIDNNPNISCYRNLDDGLYFLTNPDDESSKQKISSKIEVKAQTRDIKSISWGKLVEFLDGDDVKHELVIKNAEFKGNGECVLEKLLNEGLWIEPTRKSKERVLGYIQTMQPDCRVKLVDRSGWLGRDYILYDKSFGASTTEKFMPSYTLHKNPYAVSGTLEEWKDNIAKMCEGNPLIEFVLSFAFVAPLLTPCNKDGFGIHLFGHSSSGKTTTCRVASSVYGKGDQHGFMTQWRTTDNAFESLAAQRNDSLICLDEIGQAPSKSVGEIVYMAMNGVGKGRATREGNARSRHEWRITLLSNGEKTLNDKISENGKDKMMAGQSVRVIDIEADAEMNMGIFTKLPQGMDSKTFSTYLSHSAIKYYGSPIEDFLTILTTDKERYASFVLEKCEHFIQEYCPKDASGQVVRVADHFGMIAGAGELAIQFGILPWDCGTAIAASEYCFKKWLERRSSVGDLEVEEVLKRIKIFIRKYGDSGFKEITYSNVGSCYAEFFGYKFKENDTMIYFILSEPFEREILRGVSKKSVKNKLVELGWIARNSNGNIMETKRIPDKNANMRGWALIPFKWENEVVQNDVEKGKVHQFSFDSKKMSEENIF